jgi:HPt (histidine-containing phosphotransfer) domain-containing protein
MAANSSNADVIDWHEAMQQCGEDEEFLRELLNDLRSETETQVSNINKTIQVRLVLWPRRGPVPVADCVDVSLQYALPLTNRFPYFLLQNPQDAPYHRIMRAAHVIKGASANLMCHQLRTAAMQLEQAASVAHDAGGVTAPPDLQSAVQVRFGDLQQATLNYLAFLQSIGV